MKKILLLIAMFAVMALATKPSNAQTPHGVKITVLSQFTAGTLSGGTIPVCYGGSPGLITGTTPTGGQGTYTYQWQISFDGGTMWNDIVGATNQNYDPGVLYTSPIFRRTDMNICDTLVTNLIFTTVYWQFLAGVTTGGISPICNGLDGGILTSTAGIGGAPGTVYQWQSTTDGGTTWNDINGATTLTYTIGNLTQTTGFRLAFINPLCGTLYGNVTTITVYDTFAGGNITGGNTPICYNTNGGTLTSTATTGGAPGTTYQWEYSTNGFTYNDIVGQTSLSLSIGNCPQDYWYRVRYINSCNTLYSNIIHIVVYNQFIAGTITAVGNTTICDSLDFGLFNGTGANGGAPNSIYQWQSTTDGGITWNDIVGANLLGYDPSILTQTTGYRRKDMNTCGTLYTNVINITVYPAFTPGKIGSDETVCYNTIATQMNFIILPTGGNGLFTYQWESSATGLVGSWIPMIGETNNTLQPGVLTSTTYYHVIVTSQSGCGSGPALP